LTNNKQKKYGARITKTLTYNLANNENDADDVKSLKSVNTNLLLGDTEKLISKIKEKKKDVEALSPRALVNGEPRQHNGGLSFSVDLENSSFSKAKPKPKPITVNDQLINDFWSNNPTKQIDLGRSMSRATDISDLKKPNVVQQQKSINAESNLAIRIQNLAKQNENFLRRSSVSSEKELKTTTSSNLSMITNRTLLLRQQSAKAKRDSSATGNRNPLPTTTTTSTKTRNLNESRLNAPRSASKAPKQQPGSRSSSPSVRTLNNQQQQQPQLHTAAKDAFLRRKAYDPIKAVEDARIKQKLKQPSFSISSTKNPVKIYDNDDNDQTLNSSMDLTEPLEKLKTNIASNKQVKKFNFNLICVLFH
jgi:hypothetical protein